MYNTGLGELEEDGCLLGTDVKEYRAVSHPSVFSSHLKTAWQKKSPISSKG